MAKYVKFLVTDAEAARGVLHEVLTHHQYRYSWESPHRGLAEKGSKMKGMLLGVLAMYYPYSLQIDLNPDSTATVSLFQAGTGMMGGAIGMAKVRNELDTLAGATRSALEAKGLLRNAEIG